MHTLLSHEKPKAHGWVLGAWGPKPSLATGDVKAVTMLDEAFHLFTPCLQPDELQNLSGLSSWAQSVLRDPCQSAQSCSQAPEAMPMSAQPSGHQCFYLFAIDFRSQSGQGLSLGRNFP